MATATELNLDKYCADVAARAKRASMDLVTVSREVKDKWLRRSAQLLRENEVRISEAIVDLLSGAAEEVGLPADAVQLVSTTDRAAVGKFLAMPQYIDLAIPRGGEGLIRRVAAEAKMPVIKHFTGNCHVYVDAAADLAMAEQIVLNSKCQRMGVCNAAESLVVHADVAGEFLPLIGSELSKRGVEIRGDERTC